MSQRLKNFFSYHSNVNTPIRIVSFFYALSGIILVVVGLVALVGIVYVKIYFLSIFVFLFLVVGVLNIIISYGLSHLRKWVVYLLGIITVALLLMGNPYFVINLLIFIMALAYRKRFEGNISKKPFLIVIALITITIAGFFSWQYFNNAEKELRSEQTDGGEIKDWLTYRHQDFGFEIRYPSNYEISTQIFSGIGPVIVSSEPSFSQISFKYTNNPSYISISEWVKKYPSVTWEEIMVSNIKSMKSEIMGNMDGGSEFSVLIPKNDRVYEILFSTKAPNTESELNVFNKILDTFEFVGFDKIISHTLIPQKIEYIDTKSVMIPSNTKELQDQVDMGNDQWRLDPSETAKREGIKYGFKSHNIFILKSTYFGEEAGLFIADVVANNSGDFYTIQLIQPEKQGIDGIWVINSIVKIQE